MLRNMLCLRASAGLPLISRGMLLMNQGNDFLDTFFLSLPQHISAAVYYFGRPASHVTLP